MTLDPEDDEFDVLNGLHGIYWLRPFLSDPGDDSFPPMPGSQEEDQGPEPS
jgi:hypothetical protein